MIKGISIFLIMFSLLVFSFTAVLAEQPLNPYDKNGDFNFNETTGLINIPTARIERHGGIVFSIQAANLGEGDTPKREGPFGGTIFDSDFFLRGDGSLRLIWGVLPRTEIGLSAMHGDVRKFLQGTSINIKYLLLPEDKSLPAFAIGLNNINCAKDRGVGYANGKVPSSFEKITPYAVFSKKIDKFDLHVGYGSGRFRNRVFYGTEYFLDPKFSVIAEYDGIQNNMGVKIYTKSIANIMLVLQDKTHFGFSLDFKLR